MLVAFQHFLLGLEIELKFAVRETKFAPFRRKKPLKRGSEIALAKSTKNYKTLGKSMTGICNLDQPRGFLILA